MPLAHLIASSFWFSVIVLNPSALILFCPCLLRHEQPTFLLLFHYCWSQFCYICIQIWYFWYHNQGKQSFIDYCQYSYTRTVGLASSAHSRAYSTPLITCEVWLSFWWCPASHHGTIYSFLLCCLLYPAVSPVISDSSCVQIAEPLAWVLSSACTSSSS